MRHIEYIPMETKWKPLSGLPNKKISSIIERLKKLLISWEGTPYMSGQQTKGVACDCARFITSILDSLYRIKRTKTPRLHPDCALNSPKIAWEALNLIISMYPNLHKIKNTSFVEPGDFIVVGPINGGPGHGMIVGFQPNTLWHCIWPEVSYTGMYIQKGIQKVFRIYRAMDREKWA